ncbi:MAG: hypothetical protein A3I68_05440 [Candidatus Melainabacteria bacterium RIFCSPLOWO2_02_FULL_35_15]|nr:MAG: hypothetical protein A3F80_07750 [Candidatus Melainabacteria bacterium RIFCSPLOWO2_12_FULL_35_11]OGI12888.1 MAG: hypothetical protein A3I68_05440 [Candidatus Melainabacteria bacterium RIFCSPLOWO2_02_FULL_35_15]
MTINITKIGLGEISPPDDYSKPESSGKQEVFAGYLNESPARTEDTKKNWAVDTDNLAKNSIRTYILEAILKIPSYFLTHSELSDTWVAKAVFTIERITGTFGDMFRNMIYGHKDSNGNRDDNVGAEEFTRSEEDKKSWIPSLALFNNELQTKGKFLISALGLVSPAIANDLEWVCIRLFDGMWWRNMGINIAYGPNFSNKLYKTIWNKLFKGNEDENKVTKNDDTINWNFIKNRFSSHIGKLKNAWNKYKTSKSLSCEEKLNISQHLDKTISCFTPIVNWLSVFGGITRPLARRFDIQGLPRTIIRILSVIDRPLIWLTNIFRFYIPEKLTHGPEDRNKLFPSVTLSDLLLASTIADIFDFGLIVGENKIKESSGSLQHLVEIGRKLKASASDVYFSARRRKGLEEIKKTNANSD